MDHHIHLLVSSNPPSYGYCTQFRAKALSAYPRGPVWSLGCRGWCSKLAVGELSRSGVQLGAAASRSRRVFAYVAPFLFLSLIGLMMYAHIGYVDSNSAPQWCTPVIPLPTKGALLRIRTPPLCLFFAIHPEGSRGCLQDRMMQGDAGCCLPSFPMIVKRRS